MKAGDNTLNSLTALQCLKVMMQVDPQYTMPSRDLRSHVLEDYVKFMTTPGSHNDTYAESYHRSFFKDWILETVPPRTAGQLIEWTENRFGYYIAQINTCKSVCLQRLNLVKKS